MTLPLTSRQLFCLIFIACSGLLLTAIFIEPFKSMEPCPMCMMQRAVFLLIAITSLIACLHNPQQKGLRAYSSLTFIFGLIGAAIAGRQIWLQHLPEDRVPACGPGLEYMMEVFPLLEVIEMAIVGTGDCAKVQWTFMNLSIPGWSIIGFILIAIASIVLFRNKNTIKLNK